MAHFRSDILTSSSGTGRRVIQPVTKVPEADRVWACADSTTPLTGRPAYPAGSPALISPHVEFDLPLEALLSEDGLPDLEAE